MTNSIPNGYFNSKNNKPLFHLIALLIIAFLVSSTSSFSQSQLNFSSSSQNFHTQPKIKINPFSPSAKIVPFNASAYFEQMKMSELELELSFYPNPTSDIINVDLPESGRLSVITSSGKLLSSNHIESSHTQLDVSELSEGVYLILFESVNDSYTSRFVVEH